MIKLMSLGSYNADNQTFEFTGNAFCLLNKDGEQVTKQLLPEDAAAIQLTVKEVMSKPLSDIQIKFGVTEQTPPQVFTDGTSFFIY